MSKFKQVEFNSTVGEFTTLLARIKELTKIADACKLRLYPDGEVMLYAVDGETRKIAKMRVSFFNMKDIFANFPSDVEKLDYIIADASRWHKQFSFLTPTKADPASEIRVGIMIDPQQGEVFKFIAANAELELHSVGGDNTVMRDDLIRNAPTELIKRKLDAANGLWHVTIPFKQLDDLKKLCVLETETLVSASVTNGVVKIYQRLWHQTFPVSVDAKNGVWHFDRTSLLAITAPDKNSEVVLSVSADFMVVHESQSDFMFALELQD